MSTTENLTPLQKAHAARKQKIADGTFQSVRMSPIEKARANPRSKAMAIRAFCFQCVGEEQAVSTIRECASVNCPLHGHRPYRSKDDAADDVDLDVAEIGLVDVTDELSAQPA